MGRLLASSYERLSDTNLEGLVLYSTPASPCARRVIITLLEKRLDFDWVDVDLANMEQRSADYLALNPNGFVPTLCHGDQVIFESAVINQYLEEQFPVRPLMPKDPYLLAQVQMWMAKEGAMAKLFRPMMYHHLGAPVTHITRTAAEAEQISRRYTLDPADLAWEHKIWSMQVLSAQEEADIERRLIDWLDQVDRALQGKRYLVGDAFSQADIALYPRVTMLPMLGIAITQARYPNLYIWMSNLEHHSSFEKSLSEQSRKLQALARSPILVKVKGALSKSLKDRNLLDRCTIYLTGKVLRKVRKVDSLLTASAEPRELPVFSNITPVLPREIGSNSLSNNRELVLYVDRLSSESRRVEMLLQQLQLPYRSITLTDINQSPLNRIDALNCASTLPVLNHGSRWISDGSAISEYLISSFSKAGRWMPTNTVERANYRMWLALETGTHKEITPLLDRYLYKKSNPSAFISTEKNALTRIYRQLKRLEKQLHNSRFLLGERVQFVDIAWYTQLKNLNHLPNFSLVEFGSVSKWLSRVKAEMKPEMSVESE